VDIDPRAHALFAELCSEHPAKAIRITRCKGG